MSTVLLLGATSDMAVAIARKLAEKGNNIQLAARNSNRLQALQSDISVRYHVNCSIHEFDATDFNSHENFYQSLSTKPEITICVFGYMSDNIVAGKNWQETSKMINSNYTGAVSILNIIAEDYASKKSGTIIGISSVAGERGRQSNYIYGSAKAGFTAYLSGLRNRLFHDNVHVITILPGFVNTKMTADLKLPPLLTASPEQVADAVERAIRKKQNIVYVKWFWKWIMKIIKNIPEGMFKKKEVVMFTDIKINNSEIAFFDFDGTITSKDTLAEILKFIKGKYKYYFGILVLSPIIVSYKIGLLSNHRAKELLLTYFLKGFDANKFNALCRDFSENKLPHLLKRGALHEIRKHLQRKTPVIIISASAENWILPWCSKYNIECIATKLEIKNGKLTGKIEGRNCSGYEKVKHMQAKYKLADYEKIYAYGDSKDDLPMLALATEKNYKPFQKFSY